MQKRSGVYLGSKYLGRPDWNTFKAPPGAELVGPVFEEGRFVRWLTDEEISEHFGDGQSERTGA